MIICLLQGTEKKKGKKKYAKPGEYSKVIEGRSTKVDDHVVWSKIKVQYQKKNTASRVKIGKNWALHLELKEGIYVPQTLWYILQGLRKLVPEFKSQRRNSRSGT